MAKSIFITMLVMAATAAVIAAPAEELGPSSLGEGDEPFELREFADPEEHPRFRRVTCDLLSFRGIVGDSACALNCLTMGKAGGRCEASICLCRKTTIMELLHKRWDFYNDAYTKIFG